MEGKELAAKLLRDIFDKFDEVDERIDRSHGTRDKNDYVRGKQAMAKAVKRQVCMLARWHEVKIKRKDGEQ